MLPTIIIALGHVTSLHNIAVPTLIITARMIRSSRHLFDIPAIQNNSHPNDSLRFPSADIADFSRNRLRGRPVWAENRIIRVAGVAPLIGQEQAETAPIFTEKDVDVGNIDICYQGLRFLSQVGPSSPGLPNCASSPR